jgi:hypothetical protein
MFEPRWHGKPPKIRQHGSNVANHPLVGVVASLLRATCTTDSRRGARTCKGSSVGVTSGDGKKNAPDWTVRRPDAVPHDKHRAVGACDNFVTDAAPKEAAQVRQAARAQATIPTLSCFATATVGAACERVKYPTLRFCRGRNGL